MRKSIAKYKAFAVIHETLHNTHFALPRTCSLAAKAFNQSCGLNRFSLNLCATGVQRAALFFKPVYSISGGLNVVLEVRVGGKKRILL